MAVINTQVLHCLTVMHLVYDLKYTLLSHWKKIQWWLSGGILWSAEYLRSEQASQLHTVPFGVVGSESKPGSKNGNGDGSGGKSASWGVKINCVLTSHKVLFNKMSSSVLGRCFKYSIAFI